MTASKAATCVWIPKRYVLLLLVYPVQYMHNAHYEALLGEANVFLEVSAASAAEFHVLCDWIIHFVMQIVCVALQNIVHTFAEDVCKGMKITLRRRFEMIEIRLKGTLLGRCPSYSVH